MKEMCDKLIEREKNPKLKVTSQFCIKCKDRDCKRNLLDIKEVLRPKDIIIIVWCPDRITKVSINECRKCENFIEEDGTYIKCSKITYDFHSLLKEGRIKI